MQLHRCTANIARNIAPATGSLACPTSSLSLALLGIPSVLQAASISCVRRAREITIVNSGCGGTRLGRGVGGAIPRERVLRSFDVKKLPSE